MEWLIKLGIAAACTIAILCLVSSDAPAQSAWPADRVTIQNCPGETELQGCYDAGQMGGGLTGWPITYHIANPTAAEDGNPFLIVCNRYVAGTPTNLDISAVRCNTSEPGSTIEITIQKGPFGSETGIQFMPLTCDDTGTVMQGYVPTQEIWNAGECLRVLFANESGDTGVTTVEVEVALP